MAALLTPAIAARAGMSVGNVYKRFPDKDSLIRAVYARFFSDALYAELFLKSFRYAVITTGVCLLIAYPLAMLVARSAKRHRDLLVLLVILPFWSNFLIRIYAWMIILGPQSVFAGALNAWRRI